MAKEIAVVRLRIPEILEERGLTACHLAKNSGGRISLSAAYRYVRLRGRVKSFDGDLLATMCDVVGVEPGQLLERDGAGKRKRAK